jgi:hypothetical protein
MADPPPFYDETTLLVLEDAFRGTWTAIAGNNDPFRDLERESELRTALAEKLMALVADGVTDPVELQKLALESLQLAP